MICIVVIIRGIVISSTSPCWQSFCQRLSITNCVLGKLWVEVLLIKHIIGHATDANEWLQKASNSTSIRIYFQISLSPKPMAIRLNLISVWWSVHSSDRSLDEHLPTAIIKRLSQFGIHYRVDTLTFSKMFTTASSNQLEISFNKHINTASRRSTLTSYMWVQWPSSISAMHRFYQTAERHLLFANKTSILIWQSTKPVAHSRAPSYY